MIHDVNAALTEIQGALVARALYPTEHPLIRTHEEAALATLRDLLERKPAISMFAVDNRVIFDNRILPSSPSLTETLFRALHLCGVDRLTFHAGLERRELEQFLDALAGGVAGKHRSLESSAHLALGSLQDIDQLAGASDGQIDVGSVNVSSNAAEALSDVWNGMDSSRGPDKEVLHDIVGSLSRVVSESSGSMLPLAPLKRHDEYTFAHTINVALLSAALGEVLGFNGRAVHDLSMAALLHDVGKRAIPQEVINKTGRFTDEEFAIMKTHPEEGARMLLSMPGVPEIAAIVAYEHHIRADGTGYPKAPRSWRLNLASRIVQMADVFDALRTDRPYRPGRTVPQIIQLMKQDVGTFFDADLLLIFFLEVVSRGVPPAASISS